MENKIHGHEVMKMMIEINKPLTKIELEGEIIKKFGKDARFHTCSVQGMTAIALIEFLEKKGKFTESEQGLMTNPNRICSH
ncbi:YecH family protein [Candidatus Woesearchaeota archaeon]|nr:YecH family protein [Candidatus Woesearchaeota archaeon]